MKQIFILILALFLATNLQAQNKPSPAQMNLIMGELGKRGLTDAEVKDRLLQQGIDLEKIPLEELPKYESRVRAILDQMEREKKAAAKDTSNVTTPTIKPAATNGGVQNINIPKTPITTKEEAVAEAGQKLVQKAAAMDNPQAIYGHSLFTDQSLDVFRTTDGSRAPDTYILGAGDEIRITIFGASQTDLQLPVNSEGYIQPTGMSKIYLQGLSLLQARNLLLERLSAAYTFDPDQFAITVAAARTIMVNVFGETKLTGGFNLSALNSAFNALSAAGGPTNIGSVRAIQLIRGNQRKNMDLYAFMNDPAIQFRFDIQQNDILFVPVAQKLVTIEGAVKRPMIYEILPNETLYDLIKFAGDLRTDVFPDFVQIQRFANGEPVLKEWNLADVLAGKEKVILQNGDIVRIKSIGKPMLAYVDIEGSVYYPGRYDLLASPTLTTILEKAKPTIQAKADFLFVERIRPDETTEFLTIPFPSKKDGHPDFKLQPRDRIRIADQSTYRDVATIQVSGQVRVPFERTFSLNDKLTVKQAIEMAGGLKTSVYPVAYIFRKNLLNPTMVEYIMVELDKSGEMMLQPGDQLNIYDNSTYTNIGEIKVSGAVKNPRSFTYSPSLTLKDIFINVGGFTPGFSRNHIEVFRTNLSPTEKVKLEKITLEVDSTNHLINHPEFRLQPYDHIVVRLTPEFTLSRTVELNGQVAYPGIYPLESKEIHLSELLRMAGGTLNAADPEGSTLFRTFNARGNITMNVGKAIANPRDIRLDPILFEGDVININRRENIVMIRELGTRMAQYSTTPENTGVKTVVFQGTNSAKWYVKNYAGGFDKMVDKNSISVTLLNNQMYATKRFLFFRSYPKVKPGSTISMQVKPPKPPKAEPDKKMDWQAFWQTTLTSATAVLSIMAIAQSLK